jgi:hypothetical protein
MRLFRRCRFTSTHSSFSYVCLPKVRTLTSISESLGGIYFPGLALLISAANPAPHRSALHHTIGTSGAQRSSNPSTIQPSACYLRCFSFSCEQGVYIMLDQVCCNYRVGLGLGLGGSLCISLQLPTFKVLVLSFHFQRSRRLLPDQWAVTMHPASDYCPCHTQSYCSCVPPPPESLPLAYLPPPFLALRSTS